MSNGYTKLFASILHSTVWAESQPTRLVWITMLAMCDQYGTVSSSVPGLARAAGVSRQECDNALKSFLSPDPDSRTKDYEGRRIEAVDGGWLLLNHGKYRELMSADDRRAKDAERQARHRQRKRDKPLRSVTGNVESQRVTRVTTSDADADKRLDPMSPVSTSNEGAKSISPESPAREVARLRRDDGNDRDVASYDMVTGKRGIV